ncbi:MAG: hypothetical protein JW771_01210 [Candidatus Thermoplasmatota archaeon]|nr:hypothetical protein [Candidatus Thermoplasmatota archaeon]
MAKTKPATSDAEPIVNEAEKTALPGFDMSKYVARPIATGIVLKRKITTIPVQRPNSQLYFRAHPSEEVLVDLLEFREENKLYLVNQEKIGELFDQVKRCVLYLCVNTKGDPFLFPVPQPDETGRWNSWHESSKNCVLESRDHWIRMQPNRSIQGYDVLIAEGNLAPPKWPDLDIAQILSIAFRNTTIDDEDHPVVRQLRGLI